MKWGGWAKRKLPDSAPINSLELSERGKTGGVNLEDGVLTGFGDPSLGKVCLKIRGISNFQCVHGLGEDEIRSGEGGNGGKKALGVGVSGLGGDLFGSPLFHQFAMLKNGDLVADVFDHGQIVGNEKIGEI